MVLAAERVLKIKPEDLVKILVEHLAEKVPARDIPPADLAGHNVSWNNEEEIIEITWVTRTELMP